MPTHALITFTVSPSSLDLLNEQFGKVTYIPPSESNRLARILEALETAQVFLVTSGDLKTLPSDGEALGKVGKELRVVQLGSAGADAALGTDWIQEMVKNGRMAKNEGDWRGRDPSGGNGDHQRMVALTNASGIHVRSISQWCLGTLLTVYHKLDKQIIHSKIDKTWATGKDFVPEGETYGVKTIHGKTIGLLGYGHIGRETARLLQVFGVTIIAATSTGEARQDAGYILPGTGDINGTIPEKYYSTSDRTVFKEFLERSEVLVCSVPSTSRTSGMIGREELDSLLESLDRGHLFGAAMDVTSPEPLPDNHPLFAHPKAIVTPHLSGDVENEMDEVVRMCVAGVKRWRKGDGLWGVVDVDKGY
ncbi:hypothetical protein QFC20_006707 [Naganishia adeliensis]|uniref:Uncharacterized protein n=1 Tax=Naganishia adeliensis TaxID=92952 RepID=A0ACC2V730_9TREE|nr:hypothetical protein QFC20_006707 [Naganishia adeliensis]